MTTQELELDRALSSGPSGDPEIDELLTIAHLLQDDAGVPVVAPRRERALFVAGVTARKREAPWLRIGAPLAASSMLLVAVLLVGSQALPGDTLYPVRGLLHKVGLAYGSMDDVREHVDSAVVLISEAESTVGVQPQRARGLAIRAIAELGVAADVLATVDDSSEKDAMADRIVELRERAADVIAAAGTDPPEGRAGSGEGADDNSGSGSNEAGDDNSGPGSDDSGDDNSGSGSDDSGDDNSGSGSDDSGSHDNSGSGSDDSIDDNSGSGSGDVKANKSGSGSGDEDIDDRSGSDRLIDGIDDDSGSNSGPGGGGSSDDGGSDD